MWRPVLIRMVLRFGYHSYHRNVYDRNVYGGYYSALYALLILPPELTLGFSSRSRMALFQSFSRALFVCCSLAVLVASGRNLFV